MTKACSKVGVGVLKKGGVGGRGRRGGGGGGRGVGPHASIPQPFPTDL